MTDVIVLGGGCAGLFTAIAARLQGLDCLVLEAAPKLGGGTAISSGLLWVGDNHLAQGDSPDQVRAYLSFVAGGVGDAARMEAYAAMAPDALRVFEQAGIPFVVSPRIDHYGMAPGARAGGRILETPPVESAVLGEWADRVAVPTGPLHRLGATALGRLGGPNSQAAWDAALALERDRPGLRGMGAGLMVWLAATALRLGVEIRTGARATALTMQDGRAAGVVTDVGERIAARRAVVLAAGGYEGNAALVERFEAMPGWQSMFPPAVQGDALVMAQEQGAAVHLVGNNLSVFLGFRNPDDAPELCRLSGKEELMAPHTIVVNRQGRRFADETFFQAVAPELRRFDARAAGLPNLPAFLVFDSRYGRDGSFAGRPTGAPIPQWVARADSVAGLAAQLGIDADGLAATLTRFNADARAGHDSEFRRGDTPWGLGRLDPAATLAPIEEPPFYGLRLHPTALSSAGLLADARARVTHVRGHPIPGLYAVGNTAARTETGSGYQTGYSMASGMTFGLIAARDIAAAGVR